MRFALQIFHLTLAAWLSCATAAAQSSDPFLGRWSDDSIVVTLQATDQGYSVAIELDGETYPGTAVRDGDQLDGGFDAGGDRFAFTARIADQRLHLETEGETYELRAAAPAASRNPLKRKREEARRLDEQVGPRVGDFRFPALDGWTAEAADGGSVVLIPADAAEGDQEAYALTYMPGVDDPENPGVTAVLQQMLGPAAPLARLESEAIRGDGRPVVRRSFVVDSTGYRLDAYLAAASDGLILALGRGRSELVEARASGLQSLAAKAVRAPDAAPAQAAVPAQASSPPSAAPAVQIAPNVVRTAPDAPPFQPGTTSDGQPQSLQWAARLGGKLLTSVARTASGPESRARTLLLPDGRLEIASPTAMARGWWRILTVQNVSYLALTVDGTGQESYTRLDLRNSQVLADGVPIAVTSP